MTNPKHTDTGRDDDLMERIEGCIANAEYDDEWKTLIDARDRIEALEAENERLREELAAAYIKLSGTVQHASDCATSNAPAMKPGPCDCKENAETFARSGNV